MSPVLRARGLERRYPAPGGAVVALGGVDLDLVPGELTVVTGRSGAGKSTLLALLAGLDEPDGGWIELDGVRVDELPRAERERRFAARTASIFQDFGLIPVLSAAENVEVPLRLRRAPRPEREARVAAVLADVGLAEHADQRPAELSGGQQQRVGVARALVAAPGILLADEPTGQLDSTTGAAIMDLLVAAVHGQGLAGVVATHDAALVARADRVLHLRDGRFVAP
ncbi:MAG: ABC transporter ATP-binding protein [Actinomycetales bacterium]|nr:ABC transporter ATP-binding protein [Actinomycetales bacterium]